jgi:S-adenosylmethionine:tRNA ribosyltransferase-isomerase
MLPTPPYVKKELRKDTDYQTVYANKKGSLAAPTAGLHFSTEILEKIESKGVKIARLCLHIDIGTFLPVKNLDKHVMHKEYFEIDDENARAINERKGRLFLVGTTSVRVLESVSDDKGYIHSRSGMTDLFIKPGYKFKTMISGLITNFHLPRSTLLLLVSAFMGRRRILKAYRIAVKKKYRFYSFGDCMLLLRE